MPPSPPPGFLPFILRLVLQTRTPARAHAARGKQLEVNEAAQGRRRSYGTIHRQLHQGKPTQPHSAASGFTSPSILPARCLLFHLTTEDVAVKGLKIIKDGFSINANVQGDCQQYKREPRCKPEVFRSVFVGSTNRNGGLGSCHVSNIAQYHRKDCGVGKPSNVSLVGGPGPHVILTSDVKPLLMALIPSGACSEDKKNANSQIPGSPKPSPFSNLPDMSPKKVSSSHYVSPLQQTKMDVLLSSSSRSFYACISESTHAYQSPTKDLGIWPL